MRQAVVLSGSFSWPAERPALIGSRCANCETWSFPATFMCVNPSCGDRRVERAPLSRVGRLASWTVVHAPPPPPYVAPDPFQPFAIVEVAFPEGLQIVGPLAGGDLGVLKAGMPMETVIEPYYVDREGTEVVGWRFKPASEVQA